MENKVKFHDKDWFMWLMLVFFAPIGIYKMWRRNKFTKKSRYVISAIFSLWFIFIVVQSQPTDEEVAEKEARQEQIKQEREDKKIAKEKEKADKLADEETSDEKEKEETKKKNKPKKKTPEEKVNKAIDDVSGVDLISVKGYFEEEPLSIQVEYKAKENLTKNLTVKGMNLSMLDAIYAIKELGYEIDNLGISMKYPLVDKYGNEEDEYVIKSDFSGETLNKLSDDKSNVNKDNLETIADSWWEHPALNN